MAIGDLNVTSLPPEVHQWLGCLKELVDHVKTWSEAAGWETRLTARDVLEIGKIGYDVPVLVLDRDDAEVSLVPVERTFPGTDGLVSFYWMPDFEEVASLRRENGLWFFHFAFHREPDDRHSLMSTERFPLTEENLCRVLNDIAAHA